MGHTKFNNFNREEGMFLFGCFQSNFFEFGRHLCPKIFFPEIGVSPTSVWFDHSLILVSKCGTADNNILE